MIICWFRHLPEKHVIDGRIRAIFRKHCGAGCNGFRLDDRVNVLAITILVSSCLAGIFVVCFAIETRRKRTTSFERDSLLPFENKPRPTTPADT